jgi:hypothetical protein
MGVGGSLRRAARFRPRVALARRTEPDPARQGSARLRHLQAADQYVNQVVVRWRLQAVLAQHLHQFGRASVLVPKTLFVLNHMFADISAPRAGDPCEIIERTVIEAETPFEATHEGRREQG